MFFDLSDPIPLAALDESGGHGETDLPSADRRAVYERDVIDRVWEFAAIVPGVDPALWRRDEHGDWIHRFSYGQRASQFGWEIFDPGIGRHSQGVYAMRPMQWESYIKQYESFS